MLSKKKIIGSVVYVIFQLKIVGGRKIVQEGGEILPKVSAKFWENSSSKFTETVTLPVVY